MTGDANDLTLRFATEADCPQLAAWNRQLILDEGHRNTMTVAQLEERMKTWLAGEYRAVIFSTNEADVAYALFREQQDEIYLRQLFVLSDSRRMGNGRKCVELLRARIWPKHKRLTVEVLSANQSALAFWRAMGFNDYSLTLEIMPETHGTKP